MDKYIVVHVHKYEVNREMCVEKKQLKSCNARMDEERDIS